MNERSEDHISLTGVSKIFRTGMFKSKTGVKNLTLNVSKGKVIGLLGPNGSGKSTTIKMIMGFLKPTTGEILVCGYPADNRLARNYIGYLPENPRFQKFLTATEVLKYYGSLLGIDRKTLTSRLPHMLELVSLSHAAKERVQGFSKGMVQRLAIAQSLLHQPKLLIFDEPMSGLDPLGRMEIRKLISRVHSEMPGSTIFFSSHILEDVEQLCSEVALLRKGELKTYCSIEKLVLADDQRFDLTVRDLTPNTLQKIKDRTEVRETAIGFNFTVVGSDKLISELEFLRDTGAAIIGVASHKKKLEEALFKDDDFTLSTGGTEQMKEMDL